MKKYATAIIGCGNVAGMYGDIDDKNVQSHAQAYQNNAKTELKAVFDPDKENLSKFCKKWNIKNGYISLDKMIKEQTPEIVSICSPTQYHYQHFKYLVTIPVLGIFAEKPMSNDLKECQKIVELTK